MKTMALAKMLSLLLVVLFGVGCSSFSLRKQVGVPSFCKDLDCPRFKEEFKSDAYEIRLYEPSKWVSTTITGIDYSSASEEAFFMLFEYIQGQNVQKVKIPMTVPVANSVLPGKGPVCASNFTFSFMVPFKFQNNTPEPTNKLLTVTTLGQHKVYVRVYPGFTNQNVFPKEAAALANALNASQPYDESMYYMAGYDAPFTYKNRHNEIWFFATDADK